MELDIIDELREEIIEQRKELEDVKPGSEEEQRIVRNICELVDRLNKIDALDIEAVDKEARRELERVKNDRAHELEAQKSQLDMKRAGFEMLKIIVPGAIGGMFYLEAQKRILKFEETGRIVTSAGRDLHLPNLFTFWKK